MDKIDEILNSPDALGKIMDIAKSLTGGNNSPSENTTPEGLRGLDPAILNTLGNLMQEFNRNDDRRYQFLNSLRPYIGESNAPHIDKAVQIMRISRVIRHLFKNNFGGDKIV